MDSVKYVDRLTKNLAIANLIAQIGIIVTGGAVRLTGSGLGCSQWPMCEPGSFTPVIREENALHPLIEFGNRTLTGVLAAIAIALLIAVYKREPTASRPEIKKLAWWPLIGIAVQAIIGGITVWMDLHAAIVGSHMLISLALVAVSTYLLWRIQNPDTKPFPLLPNSRTLSWVAAASATLLVVLGVIVTGAGPHSGDESEGYRWAMDTVLITRVHAFSAWMFLIITVIASFIVSRDRNDRPTPAGDCAVKAWGLVIGATFVNGGIGYLQHFLELPIILVGLHMLGAALITASVTWALCALWPRPGDDLQDVTPVDSATAELTRR